MTKTQLQLLYKLNHMVSLEGWDLEYMNIQGHESYGFTLFVGLIKKNKDIEIFESFKFCKYKSKDKCEKLKQDISKYLY